MSVLLDSFSIKDFTHYLSCSHFIGKSGKYYKMKCTLLGFTKNGKAKIVLFGERNWKNREHIKRVAYVDPFRLSENGGGE